MRTIKIMRRIKEMGMQDAATLPTPCLVIQAGVLQCTMANRNGRSSSSACHMATLDQGTMIEQLHRQRCRQFFSEFTFGGKSTAKGDPAVEDSRTVNKLKMAGGRSRCILQCIRWSLVQESTVSTMAAPFELQNFMTIIRDYTVSSISRHHDGFPSSDNTDPTG
ncbi:hypothetical protein K504DRAFT_495042 [Pleomassaria siparia CBS 279.74]|uniref:Uncharacterized protein n=1 Tax=Pleomassaria siparia CBS 279.74 TaxID=1314801 RepID=A0A6G1JVP3_9PLEO|nr:hypothetical protein K504DRAFT_495042 [Pleomassaria siparia CBS 279.74]